MIGSRHWKEDILYMQFQDTIGLESRVPYKLGEVFFTTSNFVLQ